VHIAVINYSFEPALDAAALLERYDTLTGWCEALTAAGARVTALQRWSGDREVDRNGVRYLFRAGDHPTPIPTWWSRPIALHREAAALDADVAHVNGIVFPVQTWLLRRALPARTAIVLQDHGTVPPAPSLSPRKRLRRAARRVGLSCADGFLFTAAAQAEPWRALGLIRQDQPVLEVLEASRPLRRIPAGQARAASGLRGSPAILWVGHLDRNKDPLTVLRGFDRAADIFVLGSHREGSGYALLEALACGAIPVVSDIPSVRAITRGGTLGALFPPGDAAACASALLTTAQREPAPLRAAIAAHFEATLSWPALGRRALEAYREIVERRSARAVSASVAHR
jgi:glycosyltransferase involved in cell wall biosynthesis